MHLSSEQVEHFGGGWLAEVVLPRLLQQYILEGRIVEALYHEATLSGHFVDA